MTRRALIWCGQVRRGQQKEVECARNDIGATLRAAWNRGVPREQVRAFAPGGDLLPHAWGGQLLSPTLDELRRVGREFADEATADDSLLFVGLDHGTPEGLLVRLRGDDLYGAEQDRTPQVLSPVALAEILDPVHGQQVLIIATCHAGAFAALGSAGRRVVYAACRADEAILWADGPPRTPFLFRFLDRWAGLENGADASAPRADLEAAFVHAASDPPRRLDTEVAATPVREGTARWRD